MGKLKELRAYLGDPHATIIRKLAALSLLEVFKDTIPEYRLRVITEKEKHQKVCIRILLMFLFLGSGFLLLQCFLTVFVN